MECNHGIAHGSRTAPPSHRMHPFSRSSALICVIFTEVAAGEECGVNPPARKLSLRGAIQATIDNNVICGC
jgi:hypothetical protein